MPTFLLSHELGLSEAPRGKGAGVELPKGADPQQLPRLVVLSLVELVPARPTCTSSRRSQPLLSPLRCSSLAGLLQQSLGRAGLRVTSTCL